MTSKLNEMNNGQAIPLMWYIFILLFFRILALENIAKILTTGPRIFASILNLSVMLGNYLQQTTSVDNIFRFFFSWRFKG